MFYLCSFLNIFHFRDRNMAHSINIAKGKNNIHSFDSYSFKRNTQNQNQPTNLDAHHKIQDGNKIAKSFCKTKLEPIQNSSKTKVKQIGFASPSKFKKYADSDMEESSVDFKKSILKQDKKQQQFDERLEKIKRNILKPVPLNKSAKIHITKESLFFSQCIDFHLKGENRFFLSIQKPKKLFFNSFPIYLPEKENGEIEKIGFVEGNFAGSLFKIYEEREKQMYLAATVCYRWCSSNCFGPKNVQFYFRLSPSAQNNGYDNLKEQYMGNKSPQILLLRSKEPIKTDENKRFCLAFGSEPVIPSTHNIVLEDSRGKEAFCLFKKRDDEFGMRVQHPFTIFLAVAYSLIEFSFKLASQ